jgi:hypothetical protein
MASANQRAAARRDMSTETKTALGKEANKVREGEAKTRKEQNEAGQVEAMEAAMLTAHGSAPEVGGFEEPGE